MPSQRGGLRDPQSRSAALLLLETLAERACKLHGGHSFSVAVDDDWLCLWPRPAVVWREGLS
eukprot:8399731-Alexandrium_andersonii.AAC.1